VSSRRRTRRGDRPAPAVLVLAAVGALVLLLPVVGLLARAPWGDAWSVLTDPDTLTALRLSLWCSLWAAGLSFVLGVPLAWVLARLPFPGRRLLRAACTLGLVLPPVVGGVALFAALGRRGLVGRWLDEWFGLQLPFSTTGVVLAQTFVAMPFLVLTVESALRSAPPGPEEAARTLGASPWHRLVRVTLPSIRPALVAGTVLAWARALGEFGATITFAGSFPGRTQTLPLAVYRALDADTDRAVMLSLVLVAISFVVLVGLRGWWWGGGRGDRRAPTSDPSPPDSVVPASQGGAIS
jgi:molybdate transport system permease protein